MMYLHIDDRELFRDIIITVAEKCNIEQSIVEKDYYVTMILKELVLRNPKVVFKGGTSLSKAYHVIERFSEDIDITFSEHIGEARRKKLKYHILQPISETLKLPIDNWNRIESDKDYNHYDFVYQSEVGMTEEILKPYVKLETALMSYSFPTEEKKITSFIYETFKETDAEIMKAYGLEPFYMHVQALSRTFIDKLFAVCDYYMVHRARRNSRHLYDIFKLYPFITINEQFLQLVAEVRAHRAQMNIKVAPSARSDVNILQIVEKIINERFYEKIMKW